VAFLEGEEKNIILDDLETISNWTFDAFLFATRGRDKAFTVIGLKIF